LYAAKINVLSIPGMMLTQQLSQQFAARNAADVASLVQLLTHVSTIAHKEEKSKQLMPLLILWPG
jgi:hypothetical protein